jgi:hypothetical protein
VRRLSAIKDEYGAIDETGGIGTQVQHSAGDFTRAGGPARSTSMTLSAHKRTMEPTSSYNFTW